MAGEARTLEGIRVVVVGEKGFASSGFHPRFFHRITSSRGTPAGNHRIEGLA